jgi:hypothetical protein
VSAEGFFIQHGLVFAEMAANRRIALEKSVDI